MGVSSVVFMPPKPPNYTESSPRQVVWLATKTGKRIPAYYIPAGDLRHQITGDGRRWLLQRRRRLGRGSRSQSGEDEEDSPTPVEDEAEGEDLPPVKTTILYSHGNAADIGAMHDFLMLLHENIRVNILHYEYIGYGLSMDEGHPSEDAVYESVEAAVDFLTNVKSLDLTDIILFGTSVGSGPTHHVIDRFRRLRGVILESPFTSCCRVVVKGKSVVSSMLDRTVDIFLNVNKIPRVLCPVLIFHGTQDKVVPFNHGVTLYQKVPSSFQYESVWITGANHHNIMEKLGVKAYIDKLRKFLKHCDLFVERMDDEDAPPLFELSAQPRRRRGLFSQFASSSTSKEDPLAFE